jgi:hypothetical protein
VGRAYDMHTLVDSLLDNLSDIYFEADDHKHLVHADRANFQYMFSNCQHGNFSSYANYVNWHTQEAYKTLRIQCY